MPLAYLLLTWSLEPPLPRQPPLPTRLYRPLASPIGHAGFGFGEPLAFVGLVVVPQGRTQMYWVLVFEPSMIVISVLVT
jgi:hypothetical protein